MFDGFGSGRFAHDGAEISYVSGGSGPPVLLLHGFPQTKAMWARVAAGLARDFTVVAADLRGYGDSSKPETGENGANYTFQKMAADQHALMRSLGHERFHAIGHDRGARTVHRMALDHEASLASITLMDIIPTRDVFEMGGPMTAHAYYHWFFLAQPSPVPETMIAADPDFFYQTCLSGWGPDGLAAFPDSALEEYRRCWRDPGTIRATCADYRAAFHLDWRMDVADEARQPAMPALVLFGDQGIMANQFDVPALWEKRLKDVTAHAVKGGHFFVDTAPDETLSRLRDFLKDQGKS